MRVLFLAGVCAGLLAGCAPPPSYTPPVSPAAGKMVGSTSGADSARGFFDSLASARTRDTVVIARPPVTRRLPSSDSLTAAGWLDILRDSTLLRLENRAVDQNRDLQLAIARIREYQADLGVAKAAERPDVTANGSIGRDRVFVGVPPPISYNLFTAAASVSWELDFWGRIARGVTAASIDIQSQEANERAAILSLVADVASGYLRILELDQERTIAQQTLASRESTLVIARQRFARGVTSELDVRQFEAQVAEPAVTLAQAAEAQAQAEHALSVLVGAAPMAIPRGGGLADAVRTLAVPDSIPGSLLTRRPDVEAAERAYAAASARVGIADLAKFPTVMITGSGGADATNPIHLFDASSRVYSAQIGISVPLYDNGRIASEAAATRARVDEARSMYEQATLQAMREAADALVSARASRDEEVAQESQATALRQALALAQLRYQAGLATYLDVLDAQRSLFSAQLAVSQAQLKELTAAVNLYKAIGGTWTR